jgi:DNA-binding response OmpR family regulator
MLESASPLAQFAPNWDFIGFTVKKALRNLISSVVAAYAPEGRDESMAQPRLLLIDDEPALADYLANAARTVGFEPIVAARDEEFRESFLSLKPEMVALDLGMPVDGIELTRFLADQDYGGPVLIVSGFDRRVLESAFRLGEALGLNMVGPVEKPVRLEVLEELLAKLKATLVP